MATFSAVFLKNGNFVRFMTLKAQVGADGFEKGAVEGSAIGRPLASAATLSGRQLTIVMTQAGKGYDIFVSAPTRSYLASIKLSPAELDDIALEARHGLREIIESPHPAEPHGAEPHGAEPHDGAGGLVYQSGIDIPGSVHQQAITRVCESGYVMYQRLFFSPGADLGLKQLGERLRILLSGPSLRVQIVSDRPALPWHLLCPVADFVAEDATLEQIVGFRHEVEYLPLDSSGDGAVLDTAVDTTGGISAVLAVNEDIDKNGARRLVADQVDYWERRAVGDDLRIGVCRDRDEVISVLADTARADQILYFYCHATAGELRVGAGGTVAAGGPETSELTFTDNTAVLLRDLYQRAPVRYELGGNPLVILNACESAVLTSSFYESFLSYLIAKGARGAIGTEAVAPAVFAASWAGRFFHRLLAGQRIGAAVLAVRREFADEHRNVLGLLYSVYCDGDTVLRPGFLA